MAKRKAARQAGRKQTGRRKAGASGRKTARSGAARKAPAKRTARAARPRKAAARRARPARKVRARKERVAKRPVQPALSGRSAKKRTAPARSAVARKTPALNRERRTVRDEDLVPTPPSSLDLDRSASAMRSGRRELHERFTQHTETSPAITGGDIDADWESAYTVGDEAPGGDNPTPDQDIVDDIGKAVGVEYEDNEELKGETKIAERDRKRWELDPASSEDYKER